MQIPHKTRLGVEPETFLLWDDSVNHSHTVIILFFGYFIDMLCMAQTAVCCPDTGELIRCLVKVSEVSSNSKPGILLRHKLTLSQINGKVIRGDAG